MTNDKGIIIKNIFYMLTYAYQALQATNYKKIEAESFDTIDDLFAAILSAGMNQQFKQGLSKSYISHTDDLNTLRGKLSMAGTLRNEIDHRDKLCCTYDILSENCLFNRILKSTAETPLKFSDVRQVNKKNLRCTLGLYESVSTIDLHAIPWSTLSFQRNNNSYRMLVYICWFVIHNYLMTTESGNKNMRSFADDHMEKVFEKFILEYYRKNGVDADNPTVKWDVRGEIADKDKAYLPQMKTDIVLHKNSSTLIIDAKYYRHIWQQYDMSDPESSKTIRNTHLNQIMNYVRNYDKEEKHNVAGMLLYAQPGEESFDFGPVNIGGYMYAVKTLNLNQDFKGIRNQLDQIVTGYPW